VIRQLKEDSKIAAALNMSSEMHWRLPHSMDEQVKKTIFRVPTVLGVEYGMVGAEKAEFLQYYADLDYKDFKVGDIVLDRQDFTRGVIDYINKGTCAIKDGHVIEGNISVKRLIKLTPLLTDKLHDMSVKSGILE
jgi:hypothetical protein